MPGKDNHDGFSGDNRGISRIAIESSMNSSSGSNSINHCNSNKIIAAIEIVASIISILH